MNLIEAQVDGDGLSFAGQRLPLPAGLDLRGYQGRSVVLGLRPADFEDAAHRPRRGRCRRSRCSADVVEELGSEMNVIFRLAVPPVITEAVRALARPRAPTPRWCRWWRRRARPICTARVSSRSGCAAGEPVRLVIPSDRFFFFDHDTGVAIGGGAAPRRRRRPRQLVQPPTAAGDAGRCSASKR